MSDARPDIWQVADALQMDLRAAQAKTVQLRALLSAINIPNPNQLSCEICGVPVPGPLKLAEHIRTSHDGPVPEHWLAIEARSDATPELHIQENRE